MAQAEIPSQSLLRAPGQAKSRHAGLGLLPQANRAHELLGHTEHQYMDAKLVMQSLRSLHALDRCVAVDVTRRM